jgi:predicted nucleic acid-binding protein
MYLADTNILLRFLLRNDPAYSTIRQAVRILKARHEDLVTTSQNVIEFWNVCTRPTTVRGGLGLSVEATQRRVQLLERHFRVLSYNARTYPLWRTLVFAHGVSGVKVHDAHIVATMLTSGVANILTTNVSDFRRYPGINVYAPEEIVSG